MNLLKKKLPGRKCGDNVSCLFIIIIFFTRTESDKAQCIYSIFFSQPLCIILWWLGYKQKETFYV